MGGVFLNLGCGDQKIAGFVNIDVEGSPDVRCDVRAGLPFASGSVDGIYSEHFIEHLSQKEGFALLRECRRVLVPGGVVRVATPDLDSVVSEYASENWLHEEWKEFGYDWIQNRCEMINLAMREWGHCHLYNEEELRRMACMVGLRFEKRFPFGESDLELFRKLESRKGSRLICEFVKCKREISKDPLVSIVIPAYKKEHFAACLESALAQTYGHVEILICDDSESEDIARIAHDVSSTRSSVASSKIRYVKNQPRLGSQLNHVRGVEIACGEYIKFLCDDDLLEPQCVQRLLRSLQAYPEATIATSHRRFIDGDGRPIVGDVFLERAVPVDSVVGGVSCANLMLGAMQNFIGEPTTAMFRKGDVIDLAPHFLAFSGVPCVGNGDVTLWMNLLLRGDLVYLTESLSSFRRHARQEQAEGAHAARAKAGWDVQRAAGLRTALWDPARPTPLVARPMDERPWWSESERAPIVRAEEAFRAGDLARGRAEVESALALSQSDRSLAMKAAELKVRYADVSSGIEILDHLLSSGAVEPYVQLLRAEGCRELGQDAQALEALGEANRRIALVRPAVQAWPFAGGSILLGQDASLRVLASALPLHLGFDLSVLENFAFECPVRVRIGIGPEWIDEIVLERPGEKQSLHFALSPSEKDVDVRIAWRPARDPFAAPGSATPQLHSASHCLMLQHVHFRPPPHAKRFRSDVPPVRVDGDAEVKLLCIPDVSDSAFREVAADYLKAFVGKGTSVALVIRVEPPTAEATQAILDQVTAIISELGMTPSSCPDIVLENTPHSFYARPGIYTCANFYLACPGARAPVYLAEASACGLRVIEASADRTWAEAMWAAVDEVATWARAGS